MEPKQLNATLSTDINSTVMKCLQASPASPEFEYSTRFEVRRTNKVGQFQFQGRTFKTSEAFQKDTIGLAPTTQDGVWEVYYRHFPIGLIDFNDERTRLIHPKQKPRT